jgi:sterol desaturase/sphingolipid hydroxylase (fatty acid hydroxylase superfamily)
MEVLAYPNRTAFALPAMEDAATWFEAKGYAEPWGLCAGLGAVAIGQLLIILYHVRRRSDPTMRPATIQGKQPAFGLAADLRMHFGAPESILMLAGYLACAWFGYIPLPYGLNQLPRSYFDWHAPLSPLNVLLQLLVVDLLMFCMHRLEHDVSAAYYRHSHKPHHKFVNPQIFNAFNGSTTDTLTMILVPLHGTCQLLRFCSLVDYIAFGFTYASYLMLIHSEYPHAWDGLFAKLGVGTASDHHVHHARFRYNYGHLFTYWDRLCGTYKPAQDVFKDKWCTQPIQPIVTLKEEVLKEEALKEE